ncbi:MAG: acetyl-CoA C-acyltransferase [Bdellovibrionota bacterium]
MQKAYLYPGIRSPFGRYGGCLAKVRPDDLAAQVVDSLVSNEVIPHLNEVILGCSNQAGEDSRNIARNTVLASKLTEGIPAITVNRLCASGLSAVIAAARSIQCSEANLILAGGVEHMTRAPIIMAKAEVPFARAPSIFDSTLGARFPNPRVLKQYGAHSMPETGDEVAKDLGITREAADAFAFQSQQRYAQAFERGFFKDEILPILLPKNRKSAGGDEYASVDEHPRPQSTLEKLAKLSSLQEGGVVTAGNASGLNDGAAAMFIGNENAQDILAQKPLAQILGSAAVGVAPRTMGLGPVDAIKQLLDRFSLKMSDIDIIEINEAFASQVLGCLKLLNLQADDKRLNPHGGAIAIGHPLGASGARLALTAARYLDEMNGRYAVVSLCVGMGQGVALLLKSMQN